METVKFFLRHLHFVFIIELPMVLLDWVAGLSEFDPSPYVMWYRSRMNGYGPISWDDCKAIRLRVVPSDNSILSVLLNKLLLLVFGPFLIAMNMLMVLLLKYKHSVGIANVLHSWGANGTFGERQ